MARPRRLNGSLLRPVGTPPTAGRKNLNWAISPGANFRGCFFPLPSSAGAMLSPSTGFSAARAPWLLCGPFSDSRAAALPSRPADATALKLSDTFEVGRG